jgi:hypothetical protein
MDVTDLSKLSWAEWSLVKIWRGVLHTAHMLFWFALCVPLIQVILWLGSGAWPDLSVFNTLSWAFPAWLIDWLNYPNNWFGLHEIVAWFVWNCPLFIFPIARSWCLVRRWNFDFGIAVQRGRSRQR